MWISDVSVKRPVMATVFSALLVAFGVIEGAGIAGVDRSAVDAAFGVCRAALFVGLEPIEAVEAVGADGFKRFTRHRGRQP